jgi:hypothetical protein
MTGLSAKIARAREHFDTLSAEVGRFIDSRPYQAVGEDEAETGDWVVRVRFEGQLPFRCSAIVGDIVHNLRSALDHLIWELVLANGATPTDKTGFPIFKNVDAFNAGVLNKVSGVSPAVMQKLRELKPYKEGNGALWRLHRLDIVDKHHLLLPVVSAVRVFSMNAEGFLEAARNAAPGKSFAYQFPFQVPEPEQHCPLEDGTVVYRIPANNRRLQVDLHPSFTFDVAFGEPEDVRCESLIETLRYIGDSVERVAGSFGARP